MRIIPYAPDKTRTYRIRNNIPRDPGHILILA